ncbi:MAG: cadherin-like domain-containing protein, partial [Nitrososphaera sp.]
MSIAEDADLITIDVLTNDTDADNDTLLITSISSEPINGTVEISDSNTTITYTPYANFFGTDSITYTIEDGFGGMASGTVTTIVAAVNDAPVAVTDSYEIDEDTLLTGPGIGVIANDTDIENDTLSANLVQDTANGMLTLYSNGSFTYMPSINFNGMDAFSYLANDGDLDSNITATVNIIVSAVNDLPIANNATVSVDEDGQLPITLEGSDVDGDDLTFVITTNPANGTLAGLNASSGIVTYIPLADFNGQDSFGYMISDGSANSTTAFVTIVVNPVDEPKG